MATGKGSGTGAVSHLERLAADPEGHHVLQALRIIEASFPDNPRLGESLRPRQDVVRLGQEAELAFPTSTIASFRKPQDGLPGRLINRFFGLFGPNGPLPLHMTEYARDRRRNHRDHTMIAFVDMITHRMMGLFYRAWAASQPTASHDRGDDRLARQVSALSGYHADNLQGRDDLPDDARLFYAGYYSQGSRSPEGLLAIVRSFFSVPVELEEFVGSWLELEPDDCWQLGKAGGLGRTTCLGNRIWTRGDKFRLHIGPLDRAEYERLLPGNGSIERLEAAVRNYVGDTLDWDVQLILKGDQIPRGSLGATTRLGQTGWMRSRSEDDDVVLPDARDLILHPSSLKQWTQQEETAQEVGR